MRKEIKSMWKKITAYVLTACFLLAAIWVTPVEKVEARDGGCEIDWGNYQLVEFKGKNATWNLSAGKFYNIETGNRSNKWEKVTLKSSNRSVVKLEPVRSAKYGKVWYYTLGFTAGKKPGKATITMTVKSKKKKYTYKFNVVVRKYENPFVKLKLDSKEIQKKFESEEFYTSMKAGKHTLSVKMKKNWKIISILKYRANSDESPKNIIKSKKFNMPVSSEGEDLEITVQNQKTKEKRIYRIYVENKDYEWDW